MVRLPWSISCHGQYPDADILAHRGGGFQRHVSRMTDSRCAGTGHRHRPGTAGTGCVVPPRFPARQTRPASDRRRPHPKHPPRTPVTIGLDRATAQFRRVRPHLRRPSETPPLARPAPVEERWDHHSRDRPLPFHTCRVGKRPSSSPVRPPIAGPDPGATGDLQVLWPDHGPADHRHVPPAGRRRIRRTGRSRPERPVLAAGRGGGLRRLGDPAHPACGGAALLSPAIDSKPGVAALCRPTPVVRENTE